MDKTIHQCLLILIQQSYFKRQKLNYVCRPDNETRASKVRVIFDSCSQRSYVSQRLAKQLCLLIIGHDPLSIKTFGEESSRLRSCELVQVAVKGIVGMSLYVNAYVVPVICTPPSNQNLQVAMEQYPYLEDLELAESASNSQEETDILIGADYYLTFMAGHSKRGSPMVLLLSTQNLVGLRQAQLMSQKS